MPCQPGCDVYGLDGLTPALSATPCIGSVPVEPDTVPR